MWAAKLSRGRLLGGGRWGRVVIAACIAAVTTAGPALAAKPAASPAIVAEAAVKSVAIYRSPSAKTPFMRLANPNADGGQLVFLVKHRAPGWEQVLLARRPNGTTGWVKHDSSVELVLDPYSVSVSLGAHRITVRKGSHVVLTAPAGVGRSVLPTPTGTYYIVELLKQSDASGPYGPYAFGLSAFSNVLYSFGGGPGEIGLHGTDDPAGLGTSVSHGCIRVANPVISRLAGILPSRHSSADRAVGDAVGNGGLGEVGVEKHREGLGLGPELRLRVTQGRPKGLQGRVPPQAGRRGGSSVRAAVVAAALAVVLGVSLLAPGGARAGSRSHLTLTALEQSTVEQINALRVAHGLSPLVISRGLFDSASLHCEDMIAGGYFAHSSPDGLSFASRLEQYYPPAQRFSYYAVGENLFWTETDASSAQIIAAWMKSPPHRRNLLKPGWRQIGLAALTVPAAPGIYDGLGVTVVTVDFGVRS